MDGNSNELFCTQTQEKALIKVPCGHILVSSKWQNTDLTSALQGFVTVMYEDKLGYIDFQPANHVGVVYATEADLVSQICLKRKLAKLRKSNQIQVLVIAERTAVSGQYFQSLQKFVCLELGFLIVPVPSLESAANLLIQMVDTENKMDRNPFRKKRKPRNIDELLLLTVQCIPKLGTVKAMKLLETFSSLQKLNSASMEELSKVVGPASAQNIRSFFDNKECC